jgi:uncharacterized repeat protein (TIGR03806 family)
MLGRRHRSLRLWSSAVAALAVFGLAACGGSSSAPVSGGGGSTPQGRLFKIEPGTDATGDMVAAMVDARPGDVIEFGCGFFDLATGFQLSNTEGVKVKGCGKDETVLSFRDSSSQQGIFVTNSRGITIEDLTVLDSAGNAFELKGVNHGTLRRVRAFWSSGRRTSSEDTVTAENFKTKMQVACTQPARENPANPLANPLRTTSPDYTVSVASGRYGIYPVESRNILVEDSESIGASDAGIYVGQTNNAIIRNSRAAYNVFGFEIENVQSGAYINNIAECNTGGFLVYDLDGLTQYGKRSIVTGNIARNNNSYNFAEPGTIVANVPRGSGLITLAYDQIDIYDNVFENNDTAGIIVTSYDVLGVPGDRRLDMYSEAVNIRDNVFRNNGNDLPPPDLAQIIATQGGQITSLFPMIVGLKSVAAATTTGRLVTNLPGTLPNPNAMLHYRGAHIVWDGIVDPLDADCPYPVDANGNPVPADADGKPVLTNRDPNPSCRYNRYKFDDDGQRIVPKWWMTCIAKDNEFADDSETYFNFNGLRGLESVFAATESDLIGTVTGLAELVNFPGDFNLEDNHCLDRFGSELAPLPEVVIEPFVPSGTIDPAPTAEEVARLCEAALGNDQFNEAAAVRVDCPRLDQYGLFEDPADPTSAPVGKSAPYALNSRLFSDYSVKYRVIHLPQGTAMTYRAFDDGTHVNGTLAFPVGTVISKTFSFVNEPESTETAYETRLLIKRQRADGQRFWAGLEYVWSTEDGQRVARLKQGGAVAPASWHYRDVDSGRLNVGSTPAYLMPNANQCLSCHTNLDNTTGAAPIGPKVRNLNRPYRSESPLPSAQASHPIAGRNQLAWLCDNGFINSCPSDLGVEPVSQRAMNVEQVPIFNVPGSGGHVPGSKADIEARARAYIEVNCAHCHNDKGQASNTGMYVDVFRAVNATYGICKGPTASGTEGRGGRQFDIVPGSADDSILIYRIGPEATTPAAKMPPLARSVVHDEGVEVVSQWINEVVDSSYEDADRCGGLGGGGLLPGLPLPGLGGG